MNIVSLNRDTGIGPDSQKGAAVHLAAMRDAFSRLGHDVVAIDESRDDFVLACLERMHERSGIDLVYERYSLGESGCSRWLHQLGIPHVIEVNAPLEDEARRYRHAEVSEFQRREDALIFKNSAQVIAVSPDTARYAIERGAPESATFVHPNGIDEKVFHARGRSDQSARRFAGRRFPDAVILGFHGRLRPWHNFEALADLAALLYHAGQPVHVVAAGAGNYREILAARLPAKAYSVFPWVEHKELGALVRCFDILPLTYSADAPCYFSPLKLNEAMACGVVPVVPDLGDLPGSVKNGSNGIVYSCDFSSVVTGNGLHRAVQRLIDETDERQRLSIRAAASASNRTWSLIALQILARLGV